MFLTGNDFLEDSPYEPVNSRLSDIFRLAPIIGKNEPPPPHPKPNPPLLFHWPPVSVEIRLTSELCMLSMVYLCVPRVCVPPLRSLPVSPLVLTLAMLHAGRKGDLLHWEQ